MIPFTLPTHPTLVYEDSLVKKIEINEVKTVKKLIKATDRVNFEIKENVDSTTVYFSAAAYLQTKHLLPILFQEYSDKGVAYIRCGNDTKNRNIHYRSQTHNPDAAADPVSRKFSSTHSISQNPTSTVNSIFSPSATLFSILQLHMLLIVCPIAKHQKPALMRRMVVTKCHVTHI